MVFTRCGVCDPPLAGLAPEGVSSVGDGRPDPSEPDEAEPLPTDPAHLAIAQKLQGWPRSFKVAQNFE